MLLNKYKTYIIITSLLLSLFGCISTNEKSISYDTAKHKGLLIEIQDSTLYIYIYIYIYIKEMQLETPLNIWVKELGQYNRAFDNDRWHNDYIWDSLGIIINTYGTRDKKYKEELIGLVSKFNIHLQGLNSPEGRAGKFERARAYDFRHYKDSLEVLKEEFEIYKNKKTKKQIIKSGNDFWESIKEDRKPEQYRYPFNGFKGPLYMQGVPIYSHEKLKPLNDRRAQNGLKLFSYIDRSSGPYSWGKSSDDETEKMYDSYYYIMHPEK